MAIFGITEELSLSPCQLFLTMAVFPGHEGNLQPLVSELAFGSLVRSMHPLVGNQHRCGVVTTFESTSFTQMFHGCFRVSCREWSNKGLERNCTSTCYTWRSACGWVLSPPKKRGRGDLY